MASQLPARQCIAHAQRTFVYMLYYVLYFCWYSHVDNDVSMAVKRNTADDI